jgi:BON domain
MNRRSHFMRKPLIAVLALAAGAVAMFYLDPQVGRRRRTSMRDTVSATYHDARDLAEGQARRAVDHARGMIADARRRLWPFGRPSDAQLNERIRAQLGRLVLNPHAIRSQVEAGCVRMHGKVLRHEIDALMAGLWNVPGVQRIVNELAVYTEPGNEPDLQGERRASQRTVTARLAVTPVLALLAVVLPAALAIFGSRQPIRPLRRSHPRLLRF